VPVALEDVVGGHVHEMLSCARARAGDVPRSVDVDAVARAVLVAALLPSPGHIRVGGEIDDYRCGCRRDGGVHGRLVGDVDRQGFPSELRE